MRNTSPSQGRLICTKPFEWLELTPRSRGEAFLCCPGWLKTSIGDPHTTKPRDLWHSDKAKAIRHSVLDESFKFCSKEFCKHLTEVSGPVKYATESEVAHYQALVDSTSTSPDTLNLAHDYSCNLSCPSCRQDYVHSNKAEREKNYRIVEQYLEAFGDQLNTIYITGSGDPFGGRHFWDLLSGDIFKKYTKPRFRIHTNAQLFTRNRWEQIPHIHHRIGYTEVSIDAASEASYIVNRRGGDWAILKENMEFIAELQQAGYFERLVISFVVQDNNWHEMKSFIELSYKWNADTCNFLTLDNWGTFSEEEYRSKAIHKSSHPDHDRFVDFLSDEIFLCDKVSLGGLSDLLPKPAVWKS